MAIHGTGIVALLLWTAAARGDDPQIGGQMAREAIAICQEADLLPASERAATLASGLARAEEAVQADPQDAAAHFAIFCNLGKGLKDRSGWRLFRVIGDLRRARNELDAALTLVPNYPAALAAKGAMLVQLPRLFGGDPPEGVRLLESVVALRPEDPTLRLELAKVLETTGQRDAARQQASIAVGLLEQRSGPANELADARTFVASVE
jgi:tetratricopeptide (TPR) repeat protein